MKKLIVLILVILSLTGCSQSKANEDMIENQKLEIEILNLEIEELEAQKNKLETSIFEEKVEKGLEKYILTLSIKQSHFTLDLKTQLKDSINELEIEIPVDKEFYDSVEIGTVVDDSFRVGSLLLSNSFGSWDISVVGKEIR